MEIIDPKAYLTLKQLCIEVNILGRHYNLVAKGETIKDRTVRFYIQEKLVAQLPKVRSGPGKKYPYDTVWKVLFVRLLSTKHELSLAYVKQAVQSVNAETMRRVVTGEEPLEVARPEDPVLLQIQAAQRHAAQGFQVVPLMGVPERGRDASDWQVMLNTRDVVLKARADLSPAKLRQLHQVAELVRSILDEK